MMNGTYSPEDNKLRLYASGRLDAATFERVKAAGFRWAPRQDLFVAPAWTPGRHDLLVELCGEVGDEDTSLVDRAEDRAERFEGYSDNRANDADTARRAVASIADNIPFGQPILVGHHSERHARKDAERIENGMRRAVKMWETSQYWQQRAAGALQHAKYKERPDVRARRIKTIEADKRKQERTKAEAVNLLKAYQDPQALAVKLKDGRGMVEALLASYSGGLSFDDSRKFEKGEMSFDDALQKAVRNQQALIEHSDRWIAHFDNRLTYERAMLGEQGGTVTDRKGPEKGGAVRCWVARGCWLYIEKVNKVTVSVWDNWGNGGRNFRRTVEFDKLQAIMTKAEVDQARAAGLLVETQDKTGFVLREAPGDDTREETPAERNDRLHREHLQATAREDKPAGADFAAMREQLRAGVQIVSAPQLFPTPPELAARMVELARAIDGDRVLEPSAGTGRLLDALRASGKSVHVVAVEVNHALANSLHDRYDNDSHPSIEVITRDFLELQAGKPGLPGSIGRFQAIIMNPPFENGADIKHITHALTMLDEGGRLVALCANGPRQSAVVRPLVDARGGTWEDLPADTFKAEGTSVRCALIVVPA